MKGTIYAVDRSYDVPAPGGTSFQENLNVSLVCALSYLAPLTSALFYATIFLPWSTYVQVLVLQRFSHVLSRTRRMINPRLVSPPPPA